MSMQGKNAHKVKMSMQGKNAPDEVGMFSEVKMLHKVELSMQGENTPHEVTMPCEVRMSHKMKSPTQPVTGKNVKVRMPTQGENAHTR